MTPFCFLSSFHLLLGRNFSKNHSCQILNKSFVRWAKVVWEVDEQWKTSWRVSHLVWGKKKSSFVDPLLRPLSLTWRRIYLKFDRNGFWEKFLPKPGANEMSLRSKMVSPSNVPAQTEYITRFMAVGKISWGKWRR